MAAAMKPSTVVVWSVASKDCDSTPQSPISVWNTDTGPGST